MGLGKTLTTVSLIASTLSTARKYERDGPTDYGSSTDDDDSEAEADLDASHFAGKVQGMPEPAVPKAKIGSQSVKFDPRKIAKFERRARLERIQVKSRATLLICPLSTVTNWEDQIREHWKGNVYVEGGHQTASQKQAGSGDYTGKGKPDLRVFIYHGASRKVNVSKLADFDVVITTYNVLQTEYSKQLKTAEGMRRYVADGASSSNPGTPGTRDSDDPLEVDDTGTPIAKQETAQVTADRKTLKFEATGSKHTKTSSKNSMVHGFDVMGKKTSGEIVSPLQSIEWFRVVLDEAQ
jgi:SWI/SNF-related matrix-associated actin-dependent regulator of chromatin subfamily A3